jgi:hypothetical protein
MFLLSTGLLVKVPFPSLPPPPRPPFGPSFKVCSDFVVADSLHVTRPSRSQCGMEHIVRLSLELVHSDGGCETVEISL